MSYYKCIATKCSTRQPPFSILLYCLSYSANISTSTIVITAVGCINQSLLRNTKLLQLKFTVNAFGTYKWGGAVFSVYGLKLAHFIGWTLENISTSGTPWFLIVVYVVDTKSLSYVQCHLYYTCNYLTSIFYIKTKTHNINPN